MGSVDSLLLLSAENSETAGDTESKDVCPVVDATTGVSKNIA